MKPFTRRDVELWLKGQQTDDKEAVESEMKIYHTLKRVVVKNEVDVDMKAIKEAK